MNALQRRGRVAAVVGGLVAVGAATVMVLAGTASAAEQGRCTDNVNVRSQPSASASVVTVCKRGTDVTLGERRNGFVQLTNLNGWAAEQYVAGAGSTPATAGTSSARPAPPATTSAAPSSARGDRSAPSTSASPSTSSRPATPAPTTSASRPAPTSEPAPAAAQSGAEPADSSGDSGGAGDSGGSGSPLGELIG